MRRQPEKQEQRAIVQALRAIGAQVWVLGTHRRRGDYQGTMQTPGLPDLICILPPRPTGRRLVAIEVKAKGGRLRPAQEAFRQAWEQTNNDHIVGGLDDVLTWLLEYGYVKSIAHYRVKKG